EVDAAARIWRACFRLASFHWLHRHPGRGFTWSHSTGTAIMIGKLEGKVPPGPLEQKWRNHKNNSRLVSPNNRRKFEIIVVGSGLAGGSAAATLGELGYRVKCFCYQDSPRRAHSIAAQGGINAAKNYQNDGDSVFRTFYARGQTGQQLLLGAYQALCRQISLGTVKMFPQTEMLDLVLVDGHAKGIITRNLCTGEIQAFAGDAVVLATGGYGNVFFLSTNARGCNVTATYRAYKRGALFGNPCFTQIHPTCIPVTGHHQSKLTLMSESLRNDGRVWVPKRTEDCAK